ncbi:MAG: DUF262 domain-containing protein [Clostridiales bacterium]|nr:DUF262 domain-containing protein [Roseburia sp.]MDD7636087.1 DUF262 domain-containing protein [Clostridiales bacterium]MDY4112382.1 DUF262 domain-containing protein [Roseburia sp.]
MNKLEKTTQTNLKKIVEMVQGKEMLLPDFQRGFVWNAQKQKALIASVLAKMPIGSVLLLEAKANEYGCRILGRKDEPELNGEEEVYVLLDGQQRLTVLANVFSNLLYYDYSGNGKLETDYQKLISFDLRNRFFLKIPSVENLDDQNDKFHLRELNFFLENPESDVPDFLTGDILEYIERYTFDENTVEPYAPHTERPQKITNFCIQEDYYLIPLYLLIGGGLGCETRLKTILKNIVEQVVQYRLEIEFDSLTTDEERRVFVETHIETDYLEEIIADEKVDRDVLEKKWTEMGEIHWADKMKQYLMSCITGMDLHQIVVDASDRNRAIDIYENLNMGGIALSTFELILAKAAKRKLPANKNLYDVIVDCIQTAGDYDASVIPDVMGNPYQVFREANPDYSAAEYMGCLDGKKNQLNTKYTDAFLNILSLVSYFPAFDVTKEHVQYIKREKILELTENQICDNYEKVCRGIDRACFFLQVRCGVRKIAEINYNLMLVLIGYIFTSDEYYHDKSVAQILETWYWAAIFSGRYDKDQSEHMIEDLENVIKTVRGQEDKAWIEEMKEKVFNMPGFSDEKTLLMQTSVIPKNVIRKSICQFYLAKTYKDLRTSDKLHTFSESADTLEEHHIVPIGSLSRTYKEMEKEEKKKERKDKSSIFNSPLNFALITKKSNVEISNQPLDFYIQCCNQTGVYSLNIETTGNTITAEQIVEVLKKRYQTTKNAVTEHLEKFL